MMESLVVVLWALCGIVGALLMGAKGRPPWQGGVLGVLLGVFGILIVACLSKRQQPAQLRGL